VGPADEQKVGNVLDRVRQVLRVGTAAPGREGVVEDARLGGAVGGAELPKRRRTRAPLVHEGPGAAAVLGRRVRLAVPLLLPREHAPLDQLVVCPGVGPGRVSSRAIILGFEPRTSGIQMTAMLATYALEILACSSGVRPMSSTMCG
jgi:hypothetical protein